MVWVSSPRPSWTLRHLAKPRVQVHGEGVVGGVNPSPKGKKERWTRKLPKPPTPRGLVGLR
eukprot:2035343-Pyramimonas_sp.AAC.1